MILDVPAPVSMSGHAIDTDTVQYLKSIITVILQGKRTINVRIYFACNQHVNQIIPFTGLTQCVGYSQEIRRTNKGITRCWYS